MSRINNHVGIESADALLGSFGDDHVPSFGEPIRIYKFRKLSGIIRITPQGEQSLKTDPAFFTQVVNLYTSKEPVVVLWEGSTSIKLDEQDRIVKTTNVGDYYDLFSNSSFTTETKLDDITFVNNEFTAQSIQKKVELNSLNWLPSDSDMSDYVYLILDKRAQSYQWLEITSISPNYNPETKVLDSVDIDFDNIGIKYAASGKNILDFFQFGAIGEGYAFPKEEIVDDGEGNETVTTTVDNLYLNDIGITSVQWDFMCGAADSSYAINGRKIGSFNEDGDYVLDKPHRLFLHEELFPKSSNIFFNQPNSNSFMYEGAEPDIDAIWKSYKEQPVTNNAMGNYNVLQTKEVLTGFKMTRAEVLASNEITTSYSKENWNNVNFFKMKKGYNFNSVKGIKNVIADPNGWVEYNYTMFLNFNSYVNSSSNVFNFDLKETKKYKLTDTLGVLGGIINIVVGGLDIGWTATNSLAPNQPMNLRFPCISYLNGIAALNETAPLPCDVFLDDKAKQVIPVNTNVMTSHRFSLTDKIVDTSQVRAGAEQGKGGDGIWYTKYLEQTKFEDGTLINTDGSPFEWNPPTTSTFPPSAGQRWIVDTLVPHVITNADVRLTAYVEKYDINGRKEDISVYQSLFATLSKSVNDIRLWGSVMKFNYYDQFNSTGGQAKWPEIALPPPPELDKTPIQVSIGDFTNESLVGRGLSLSWNGFFSDEETKTGNVLSFSNKINITGTNTNAKFDYYHSIKINSFTFNGVSPSNKPINSLDDLRYVYIKMRLNYTSTAFDIGSYPVDIEIYGELTIGAGENEQTIPANMINIIRTQSQGAKTDFSWNIIGGSAIGTLATIYILKTEEFFNSNVLKLTRNPTNKTVNVEWIPAEQQFVKQKTNIIPPRQGNFGASMFFPSKYDISLDNVLLLPR